MHSSPHVVSDVMTRAVVAVGRDTPFKDIVQLMDQCRSAPCPYSRARVG